MNVAIYLRVSTNKQNCEIQKEDLIAYCQYKRYEEVTIFEDVTSGTTNDREKLNELMSRLDEFDELIIWKLDRLCRSLINLLNTIEKLRDNNVILVSLKENLNLGTKEGRLMMQLLGSFAEYEVEAIRERIKSGVSKHIEKHGKWGPRPPTVNEVHVNELRKKGYSIRQIAIVLDSHPTQIARILKRT